MKICLLLFAALLGPWVAWGQAAPDFAKAHVELTAMLRDFVRIQTPNGNETQGALFLKKFLDEAGIASEIVEMEAGRGSLIARIKGSGKKRALLLMGHIDTVGVEREKWTVDPYGGIEKEGFLYGRGVRDDKAMTCVNLSVFLHLARLKIPLDRDVIYLAEAGEEGAAYLGMDFLVAKHWEKIECEFALNEGGGIDEQEGKVKFIRVATSEKVPRPHMLTAKGVSGHGSRPRVDNPIVHLAAAIAKIGQWQPPMRLNDTTRAYFSRLAQVSAPADAFRYGNLENPAVTGMIQEFFRHDELNHNSMLRTTVSPNMFKGGFLMNVIPGDANATLDIRALPDENIDAFIETLRALVADPAIAFTPLSASRPATPPSRLDSELFQTLERMQKKHFPEAALLPTMITGATDSAQLRARGVQAYGIGPVGTEADSLLIHGNDERLSIAGLRPFTEFLWDTVVALAGAGQP